MAASITSFAIFKLTAETEDSDGKLYPLGDLAFGLHSNGVVSELKGFCLIFQVLSNQSPCL